ncbi:MAG TPA: hypothetical protein VL175_00925 [Pirellulales bacterium]|nr:hypothetical protein [Pirellulales bacterium]
MIFEWQARVVRTALTKEASDYVPLMIDSHFSERYLIGGGRPLALTARARPR